MTGRRALPLLVTLIIGCAGPPIDITLLVVQDSTYLDQETMEPYSGRVFRPFDDDPTAIRLSGSLKDGRWNGELTVYHPTGHIRYQGELMAGERCGAWLENRDEDPPGDVLAQVMEEIESLAMYPPCSES